MFAVGDDGTPGLMFGLSALGHAESARYVRANTQLAAEWIFVPAGAVRQSTSE